MWTSPTERPDLGGKEADDNRYVLRNIYSHVMWTLPTERPDLGGKEADDNRFVLKKRKCYCTWNSDTGCKMIVADISQFVVSKVVITACFNV